jgi:hypothetical protein
MSSNPKSHCPNAFRGAGGRKNTLVQWDLGFGGRPQAKGCQKLVALEGYRIRVGVFRITYGVDDDAKEVTIYSVLRRKDAYR